MQITFNSYEEMMDFMEKIQGRVSAKEEKAVITAEEMKQHSVSESCQSILISSAGTECATRIYAGCSDCTCTDCSSNLSRHSIRGMIWHGQR